MNPKFSHQITQSLQDTTMHTALSQASLYFDLSRTWAFADIPDRDALRHAARQIKERAMENLDQLLEQLRTSVGGHFYLAANAQDAHEYLLELVRKHGVKKAVKSSGPCAKSSVPFLAPLQDPV